MEPTPFDLTPEQKGLLVTLSRATGKPIPTLIAEALDVLQEREHRGHQDGTTKGSCLHLLAQERLLQSLEKHGWLDTVRVKTGLHIRNLSRARCRP